MKLRVFWILCILLLLGASQPDLSAIARPAAQTGDEPPHPHRVYGPAEPSKPPGPLANLPAFKTQAGGLPWTALVFQLYTTNGWNIAYQGSDSQVYLLTDDPAIDLSPRLSNEGTRVAFVSKDDKNYRLVTLNLTNGERRTLTEQLGDAAAPTWSPDGSRIAFEWQRNGNADIWAINTDGSGLVQLTFDPDYDGMPSWSPDGSRLAFVSRRTGGYRVYSMKADGANPIQLSNQAYSGDPVWSPDGKSIAYDADSDENDWFELWTMDASGANQTLLDKAHDGTLIDYMMGSWSPDGKMVAFSEVHWLKYGSDWYIEESYIKSMDAFNHITSQLVSYNTAMYPDWVSMDRLAPVSQVLPLPRFARPNLLVIWTGNDPGGSGIAYYDVQSRDTAGGNWVDWMMKSAYPTSNLNKTGGHTYELRSRAQDVAFNLESWPKAADAAVTLYNWMIEGMVRNNRGAPVPFPTIQTSGSPFFNLNDERTGSYQIFAANAANSYTTSWQKNGYGSLPQTSFPGQVDAAINPVLPPANNLVAYGNFETSGLAPAWSVEGDFSPTQTGRSAFTGLKGAWLGENNFLPFQSPFESWPYNASLLTSIELGLDAQNRIHLAWANDYELFYGVLQDGVWEVGPLTMPDTYNSSGDSLSMQISPEGVAHFSWSRDQRIYYRRYDHGTWSSMETASDPNYISETARLHLGPDGTVQMVYARDYDMIYARRTGNAKWTSDIVAECSLGPDTPIFQDQAGVIHVTCGPDYFWRDLKGQWNQEHFPVGNKMHDLKITGAGIVHAIGSWDDDTLNYAYRLPGIGWSQIETVDTGWVNSAKIGLDPNGQPRVLASYTFGDPNYHYQRRISANNWSAPELVNELGDNDVILYEIGQDGSDHVYRYWSFAYLERAPVGGWSIFQEDIDANFSRLKTVKDSNGRPYLFGTSDYTYMYAGPPLSATNGNSRLSQTISIPGDLPAPTLSYLLDYSGTPNAAASGLSLTLNDGASQTELNHLVASSSGWSHYWHDLSAWAGQTVTLTFQVDSAAGYYQTHARLDDVSLGASHPTLWVLGSGPRFVRPGEQAGYAIQAGAYNGPLAPNTVLTTSLPAGWDFLSANPVPDVTGSQLAWQLGDLAGGTGPITIQLNLACKTAVAGFSELSIPLEVQSSLSEIDTEDNQATIPVTAAYPLFLPLIQP